MNCSMRWIKRLNVSAREAALEMDVHAATDITGFSLICHAWEMADASNAGLKFYYSQIPFLDDAREYASRWIFPGGAFNNREYYQRHADFAVDLTED